MRSITTARDAPLIGQRCAGLAPRFSGLAASCRMPWSAGFITNMSESNFSVRTGAGRSALPKIAPAPDFALISQDDVRLKFA
jgi:hypothetical protein